MKNLLKVIKKLNAPVVIAGEAYPSDFDFKVRREDGGLLTIYDANERYHIDYLYEQNCLLECCAEEFGFDFVPLAEDKIMNQLTAAVRADFGDDAYIDWLDGIEMVVSFDI